MKNSFDKKYPNIARWVEEHEGILELGWHEVNPMNSFIAAFDSGGESWYGKESYETIDAALMDADNALAAVLKEIYGE